jgi:hypothetical protein
MTYAITAPARHGSRPDMGRPEIGTLAHAALQPMHRMATPCCRIRLIHRASGKPHLISGQPLVLYSRAPEEAAADLLRNRDPRDWRIEVEPMSGHHAPDLSPDLSKEGSA